MIAATVFGVGYTPLMPGTTVSVVGVLLFIICNRMPVFYALLTLLISVLAFMVSGIAENIFGEKDCKRIVIDDLAGMMIALVFIPFDVKFIIIGFFLFRMFDMIKVPPANRIENYHGSLGVVGDDLIAGIYANLFLQLTRFFT
jgi:phosphatidylglycerophosphatase A